MLRLLAVSIAATLMSAMPADKQNTLIGFFPAGYDPNGYLVVEPHYAPPQGRRGNIVAVTADGRTIFCFCGGTSF